MRKMLCLIMYLGLLVPRSALSRSVPNCTLKDERVERQIAEKARRLHGAEYCQFRRYYTTDDIDGDGKDDFIVIYVVEGAYGSGNHFLQFMDVYLTSRSKSKPLEIQVGERGERSVDEIDRVEKGRIITKDEVWQNDDAMCCPTGTGQSVYAIRNGKIIRSK